MRVRVPVCLFVSTYIPTIHSETDISCIKFYSRIISVAIAEKGPVLLIIAKGNLTQNVS